MNPNSNTYYHQSLSYINSIRDKTKSNIQPVNYPGSSFTPPSQSFPIKQNNNTISNHLQNHNNSFVGQTKQYPSDKYKSFYTQNYAQQKSRQKHSNYDPNNNLYRFNQNHYNLSANQSAIFPSSNQNRFTQLRQQKSLQRKRFFTTTNEKQPSYQRSPFSNSFISQPSKDILKQPYQFVGNKFTNSKVQKTNDHFQTKSRQNRLTTMGNNQTHNSMINNYKSQVYDRTKKISLKRDIISPRYDQFDKQKKKSLIQERSKVDQLDNKITKSTISPNNKESLAYSRVQKYTSDDKGSDVFGQFSKKKGLYYFEDEKENKRSSYQEISKINEQTEWINNNPQRVKQQSPKESSQLAESKSPNLNPSSSSRVQKRQHQNPVHLIDSDIYQDMKISRIQESTQSLEQKFLKLLQTVQTLTKNDKQRQKGISQVRRILSQSQRATTTATLKSQNMTETDYTHQLKRIKKQLKIIKNNFQLAFTSMTEQINRKLVKEQQIMKNLSEQIKLVADQNVKLSQSIEQKSSKVKELQRSMNSFMQQNQQRIQNLVLLNDSFSSSKRNKTPNHSSFEYGIELRNMSGDEGTISTRDKEPMDTIKLKVDLLQKEIKKMKVFHMEQKDIVNEKINFINKNILSFSQQLSTLKIDNHTLPQQIHSISTSSITSHMRQFSKDFSEKLQMSENKLSVMISHSLQQMKKTLNDELYQLRLAKIHPIGNRVNQADSQVVNDHELISDSKLGQIKSKIQKVQQSTIMIGKKLNLLEEKQYHLNKSMQDQKLREIKHSGDIRQLQLTVKQLQPLLTQSPTTAHLSQTLHNFITKLTTNLQELQQKLQQTNRINQIQTENIQSINNEFQRVINKQIIPKFHQLHNHNVQVEKKLTLLNNDLKNKPKLQTTQKYYNSNSINNDNKIMENKIQQYLKTNINKFINTKVKLLSSKTLSNKSPLAKLGLHGQKYSNLSSSSLSDNQTQLQKQNTYLIDQNGYLMDWQGCYLLETSPEGIKTKIKLTQKQLYFMEVNGLQVHHVPHF